eukprot:365330-Chlamydomonas_euryale.AAC.3
MEDACMGAEDACERVDTRHSIRRGCAKRICPKKKHAVAMHAVALGRLASPDCFPKSLRASKDQAGTGPASEWMDSETPSCRVDGC